MPVSEWHERILLEELEARRINLVQSKYSPAKLGALFCQLLSGLTTARVDG